MTHCEKCGKFTTAKARMTQRLRDEVRRKQIKDHRALWRWVFRNVGKDAR